MTIKNILAVYDMATPEEIREGVVWYATALAECKRISIDNGIPLNTVVGVTAALSPNNKWTRNILNARDMVEAYLRGDSIESFKVSTYTKMKEKAWSILDCSLPYDKPTAVYSVSDLEIIEILKGQKIISFFENIMGYDGCTIDGHARNIAYAERIGLTGSLYIGKKEYKILQEDYVKAASMRTTNGRPLKAFEMQAVTWVTWRRIHNIT